MILDNADDLRLFNQLDGSDSNEEQSSALVAASVLDFLPQSPNGSILITSRSRDAAFRLTGSVSNSIQVEPMNQDRAVILLRRKLKCGFDMNDAVELLQVLDYMPLAITQAAAYISQRAPRITVSKYLREFCKSDRDRTRLLKKDVGDIRRDGRQSNSIITTWQISFDHIRKERPAAARLLSLISLFDRQEIPDSLLYDNYQEDGGIEACFEDDINILTCYSLVKTNVEGNKFEMHRLVQFSMKKWLELSGELEKWKEKYITIMYHAFPIVRYGDWATCQTLFPHVEVVLEYQPMNDIYLAQWAFVLFRAAWYAHEKGNYDVAEKMYREALEGREKMLGKEHPDTLTSVNNLASVLRDQGEYEEAEVMNRRALEGWEKVLWKEHPDTLRSVYCLASLLHKQKRYKTASELYQRASSSFRTILGPSHPITIACDNHYNLMKQEMDTTDVPVTRPWTPMSGLACEHT
jgi:tetratricopeptide (TPR) repeat protein